jgi:hypothetical protein
MRTGFRITVIGEMSQLSGIIFNEHFVSVSYQQANGLGHYGDPLFLVTGFPGYSYTDTAFFPGHFKGFLLGHKTFGPGKGIYVILFPQHAVKN